MWVTFNLKSKWQGMPRSDGRIHHGDGTDNTKTLNQDPMCSQGQNRSVLLE